MIVTRLAGSILTALYCWPNIFALLVPQSVDVSSETQAYRLKLADELVGSLK